jgi:hypothetical protein
MRMSCPRRGCDRFVSGTVVGWPGLNQWAASQARSSAKVLLETVPLQSVVRSSVSSWISTSTPSAVSWLSASIWSTRSRTAFSNAGIVFSGA